MSEIKNDETRKPVTNKLGSRFWGYRSRQELAKENLTDGLTGLLNKKGWDFKTEEYLKIADRTKAEYVFSIVDLDGLKKVNDTLGHKEGDRLIVKAAQVLRETVRSTDILARIGGDEFAVLLTRTSLKGAENFKSRLLEKTGDLKLSVGIGNDFNAADAAMYQMKRETKNE